MSFVKSLFLRGGAGSPDKKPKDSRLSELLKQAIATDPSGVIKSSTDTRVYRYVTLPNGLGAMLVSDPKAETAAAALSVSVGSFSDPDDLYGLAHFLEHMLFLGTEKYPRETEYSEFLAKNGGYSNAYTASELTNYHFEVISSELKGALDRFAQFFIAPLFTDTATEREMKAVDNECSGNQQNDSWRGFLIFSDLARDGHPFHKFNIGNLKTLRDDPKAKGIDVRKALIDFHERYYSANRMRLVVVGKESLDELGEMVTELFSEVKNKNVDNPYSHPFPTGPAFAYDPKTGGNLGQIVHIVPVMDLRRVELSWVFPPCTHSNKKKEAIKYLCALLGDEGEGSILSALKKNSWANGLSAGPYHNFDFSSIEIQIDCTDIGVNENAENIVEVVFAYINMLKKKYRTSDYFFEEEKITNAISYWFKPEAPPMQLATTLAATLQEDLDPLQSLALPHLLTEDTVKEFAEILNSLTPETLSAFFSTKKNEGKTDRAERYFGTKYRVQHLSQDLIVTWKNTAAYDKLGLDVMGANKFIPNSFSFLEFETPKPVKVTEFGSKFLQQATAKPNAYKFIKQLDHTSVSDKKTVANDVIERSLVKPWELDSFRPPVVIDATKTSLLWLKQDTTFRKPKANVRIFLKNPELMKTDTAFTTMAAGMFLELLQDELNEITYPAKNAGFSHEMGVVENGIILTFYGFSETLHKYIELVAGRLKDLASTADFDPATFERFKEKKIKHYSNISKQRPVSLAMYASRESIVERSEPIEKMVATANDVTREAVAAIVPKFLSSVAVEVFVSGNAHTNDARNCLAIANKIFQPTRPVSEFEFLHNAMLAKEGNPTQMFFLESARDDDNPGSGFCTTFQFGTRTNEKIATLSIFKELCHERYFDQLRTKEQLGYIVFSQMESKHGVLSMYFLVESNSANPIELNYRTEAFLDKMEKLLNGIPVEGETPITQEVIDAIISAEINRLLAKPKTLKGEEANWWHDISNGAYTFEIPLEVAQALSRVKLEDIQALMRSYLWSNAPNRAKFVTGMLADIHGTAAFGDEYNTKIKVESMVKNGAKLGFNPDFVMNFLKRDEKAYKDYVEKRGDVVIIQNPSDFRAQASFYPNFAEVISARL